MNQDEKRIYLIRELLAENPELRNVEIPEDRTEQWYLLRSLFNIRMPGPISEEILKIQDEFLQEEIRKKGITDISEIPEIEPELCLWQGDITTLRCDAIVNAANSGMTGCYQPCHNCIDNCIHTFAGIQLRNTCAAIMEAQGYEEPTGQAKVTDAFNLPARYVLHTVGPIVQRQLTGLHEEQLASCYRSCLEQAELFDCSSLAFCCISTGVFGFPNRRAAEIAVKTVQAYKAETKNHIKVVFNVFKNIDYGIYRDLLG